MSVSDLSKSCDATYALRDAFARFFNVFLIFNINFFGLKTSKVVDNSLQNKIQLLNN